MAFLKLGFRSLFRQKRRTVITLTVIMFGMGCLLLSTGHSKYIDWGLRETTIHSETGHLQLFHENYFTEEEYTILQYGIDDFEKIRSDLMKIMDVSEVLARIDLMGLISNGDKSVACIGQGIEPRLEKKIRTFTGNSGSMYDSLIVNEDEMEIIALGSELARSLNAKKGDYLTLMATTADGALNAIDVRMVGTLNTNSPELDKRAIMVPLQAARMLLNTKKVKNLLVILDETEKTDRLFNRISRLSEEKGYKVRLKKWHELAVYYKQVKQFYNQIIGFISLVLFIIVFFSTSNTIMMSIIERTTEIGTMLSIGTSRWQTLKMFFFEGTFIGIIGGILSIIFAYLLSLLINYFDIRLPSAPGLTGGYPLQIRNEFGFYITIITATVVVAVFSSILPAFKVTKMKIVDALGHI